MTIAAIVNSNNSFEILLFGRILWHRLAGGPNCLVVVVCC